MKKVLSIFIALLIIASLAVSAYADDQTSKATHNNATVLHTDTVVEIPDAYKLSNMYAEILSDRGMDMGWNYYYVDSADNGAQSLVWEPADGDFTGLLLMLDCTNLSDSPCRFGEMAKMRFVFDEGDNEKVIKAETFQVNPGQTDSDGYDLLSSTEYKEIPSGETTKVRFIASIDKSVHDALVEEEIPVPAWAYIDFSNGDSFCVDMKADMIRFGYDESDYTSMIVNDVHRTMNAATGYEYMEEFLTAGNLSEIIASAGMDIKDAAQSMSVPFNIKVNDVTFEGETSATATCTVISPDYVQVYQNLDELYNDEPGSFSSEEEFYNTMIKRLIDYVGSEDCPLMTRDLTMEYEFDNSSERYIPADREKAMNEMRIALINF